MVYNICGLLESIGLVSGACHPRADLLGPLWKQQLLVVLLHLLLLILRFLPLLLVSFLFLLLFILLFLLLILLFLLLLLHFLHLLLFLLPQFLHLLLFLLFFYLFRSLKLPFHELVTYGIADLARLLKVDIGIAVSEPEAGLLVAPNPAHQLTISTLRGDIANHKEGDTLRVLRVIVEAAHLIFICLHHNIARQQIMDVTSFLKISGRHNFL